MTAVQHTVSRFHYLERPVAPPAKCMVCMGYNNPVVDFGMSIDRYGAVVICVPCITEAGRVVGLVSAGEVSAEKQYAERFIENYLNDNSLVAIPRDFFDTALDSVRGLSDALAGAILHVPVEAESDVSNSTAEAAGDNPEGSSSSGSEADGTSGQGSRSSRRKRPNVVSNDSGDEFLGESIGP